MGVVIETHIWEPGPWLYLFLFSACFSSIFFLPYLASHPPRSAAVFDPAPPASFVRFQTRFLLVFSLCSGLCFLATGAIVRALFAFCSLVIFMCACSSSSNVNPKDGSFAAARFSFCSYVLFPVLFCFGSVLEMGVEN